MAGFIHSKLDIKLLVLYITSRLAGPVDFTTLTDLTLCDDGADYFQAAEVISELVESGHLTQSDELYQITEKGRRNIADGESSLSPVIRKRCDRRLAPLNKALKRSAQVRAEVEQADGSSWVVRLSLGDESGNLFSLSLLAPSEETGCRIAEGFNAHPERIYNGILGILLDEHRSDPT